MSGKKGWKHSRRATAAAASNPRTIGLLAAVCLALNGCVMGYRQYPKEQSSAPYPDKTYEQMYFRVQGSSLFGGAAALRNFLRLRSPFKAAEYRDDIPAKGLYIRAKVETFDPSIASAVFGYISYSTLMISPMWSTRDGNRVVFEIFKDGNIVKTFEYEARRTTVGWLGLLPFAWVNFITASEEDVFESFGKRFFVDARPTLTQATAGGALAGAQEKHMQPYLYFHEMDEALFPERERAPGVYAIEAALVKPGTDPRVPAPKESAAALLVSYRLPAAKNAAGAAWRLEIAGKDAGGKPRKTTLALLAPAPDFDNVARAEPAPSAAPTAGAVDGGVFWVDLGALVRDKTLRPGDALTLRCGDASARVALPAAD